MRTATNGKRNQTHLQRTLPRKLKLCLRHVSFADQLFPNLHVATFTNQTNDVGAASRKAEKFPINTARVRCRRIVSQHFDHHMRSNGIRNDNRAFLKKTQPNERFSVCFDTRRFSIGHEVDRPVRGFGSYPVFPIAPLPLLCVGLRVIPDRIGPIEQACHEWERKRTHYQNQTNLKPFSHGLIRSEIQASFASFPHP